MHTDFSLRAKVALEYQMEKFEDTKKRPRKPKDLAEALSEVKRLGAEVARAEVQAQWQRYPDGPMVDESRS
jgi:hypothetical protein